MDAVTLASTVVKFLVPYLSKVAEPLANKAADAVWENLQSLFSTLKNKFAGNTYAEETLKRVKDDPQSQSRQAALVGVLEEQIKGDLGFAETLQKLVTQAESSGVEKIIQNVNIGGHARTGNVTTIGKVEGSVHQNQDK